MKKIRIILVVVVSFLLPFMGVLRIGHTGITDNMAIGSCSSLSLGGNISGSSESGDSGTASFSTGEPIDIPVSIAKGVEPVDATQFQAEFGGGSSLIKGLSGQQVVSGQSIIIRGKTKQSQVTVVAYVSGNQVFEQNVGDDKSFTMTTTTAIYGIPIAFVVVGENGYTSYPVIVTLQPPSDLFDFLNSTFHITNVTGIAYRVPAVSLNEVAYPALDIFDNALIARSPIDGGYPELLSDEPSGLINYSHFSSDGSFLVGITSDGTLYKMNTADGVATILGTTNVTNADLKLSLDDAYVVTHYKSGTSFVLQLIEIANPDNTTILTASTDTADNTAIYFNWITEDLLLVLKNRAGGSQVSDVYNLNAILGTTFGTTTTLTPTNFMTSSSLVGSNPVVDPYIPVRFASVCDAGATNGLCLDTFGTRVSVVDADQGLLDVSNPTWTANGEIILFDALPASDDSARVVAAYILDTQETVLLGYGFNPRASPVDANIVMYQSYDITGEIQMGLFNLATHSETASLFE